MKSIKMHWMCVRKADNDCFELKVGQLVFGLQSHELQAMISSGKKQLVDCLPYSQDFYLPLYCKEIQCDGDVNRFIFRQCQPDVFSALVEYLDRVYNGVLCVEAN